MTYLLVTVVVAVLWVADASSASVFRDGQQLGQSGEVATLSVTKLYHQFADHLQRITWALQLIDDYSRSLAPGRQRRLTKTGHQFLSQAVAVRQMIREELNKGLPCRREYCNQQKIRQLLTAGSDSGRTASEILRDLSSYHREKLVFYQPNAGYLKAGHLCWRIPSLRGKLERHLKPLMQYTWMFVQESLMASSLPNHLPSDELAERLTDLLAAWKSFNTLQTRLTRTAANSCSHNINGSFNTEYLKQSLHRTHVDLANITGVLAKIFEIFTRVKL